MATSAKDSRPKVRKVGPYRLAGELGRGGMAQVYRGVHELISREVAIKEVLPTSAREREALERLQREALALAAFRHQNIVTLYDLIEKNDGLYLVMELVDGPTLAELLREAALPPDVAAVVAFELACALEHAHFHGIVHRDLKPANVMLTRSGEVKLMDFGIAKDPGLETLTQEGLTVGTPAYMSPEQVMGDAVDGRTDLYSLGVVLYEALSGSRPFVGDGVAQIFARIREGKHKPLRRVARHVPWALRRVVSRLMRVKPQDRFADASAARRELESYLAKRVRVPHSTVLLAFLHQRGLLDEGQLQTRAAPRDLERLAGAKSGARRTGAWVAWLLALGAAGALALAGWQLQLIP